MINNIIENVIEKTAIKRRIPFWRYQFDLGAYFQDFEWTYLKKNLLIAFIILLFGNFLFEDLFTPIVEFIFKNMRHAPYLNFIFYYIFIPYLLIFITKKLYHGYIPTMNSVSNSILYFILFVIISKKNNTWNFLPLEYQLKYLDVAFITVLFLGSKWSLYFTRRDTNHIRCQFIVDKGKKEDLFGYSGLSKQISGFIHHTDSTHSFAIGIIGNWGDGKSFFANQLKEIVEEYRDDNIVLEFNPWLYEKDVLIESFFMEFLNAVSNIDKCIKDDFISYLGKLIDKSDNEKFQYASIFFNLIQDKRSIDQIKESINTKITLSRKKLIVFIDDTDRLDTDEIYNVLKIIRNSANFANTFFIAGIDFNYINSKMNERSQSSYNSQYLEKIFNVLIALPKINISILKSEIKKQFKYHFPKDEDLFSALDELMNYEWFMSFLTNIRQLNRLINSLKISYQKLHGNVDYRDLIILETLKNGATVAYLGVYNKTVLNYNFMMRAAKGFTNFNGWELNEDETKKMGFNAHINEALNYLIQKDRTRSSRSFVDGYDLLYFNYSTLNIDIIEFYSILDLDKDEIVKTFNNWLSIDNDHWDELLRLLTSYLKEHPFDNYTKFIPILLRIKNSEFADRVFNDVYLSFDFWQKSTEGIMEFQSGILSLLKSNIVLNPYLVLKWNQEIFKLIIGRKNSERDKRTFEKLQKFIKDNCEEGFMLVLESNNKFEDNYNSFLQCFIDKDYEQDRFILSDRCIQLFKNKILLTLENQIKFLKASIKPYWNNNYSDFSREVLVTDFVKIIFPAKDELKEVLVRLNTTEVGPLSQLLLNNLDKYYESQRSPFTTYIKSDSLHRDLLQYFNSLA
ncbi:P-loop NTPase fold protein [Sphingobacterium siyangense]|uniref:KAP family P-loop NTPase fold protein n=1 Tax=Sphingobacterium siyangense TaxID=459529 RepID=UPI002FDB0752